MYANTNTPTHNLLAQSTHIAMNLRREFPNTAVVLQNETIRIYVQNSQQVHRLFHTDGFLNISWGNNIMKFVTPHSSSLVTVLYIFFTPMVSTSAMIRSSMACYHVNFLHWSGEHKSTYLNLHSTLPNHYIVSPFCLLAHTNFLVHIRFANLRQ